jgi:hypothetical protein
MNYEKEFYLLYKERSMNIIYDFLRSDGSIVVNKNLSHAIGLHEAIIFSELLSKYNYFKDKEQLDDHGYFYNTADHLRRDTTLSPKQQRKAIKQLEELGLIKTHLHGVPAKRYFKICEDIQVLSSIIKQYQQFGKKVTTSIANSAQLVEQKGHGSNTNIILKNNTNIYITLASDGCSYTSFYLSCFYDYYNKEHMRVKEKDLGFIETGMDEIKDAFDYCEYTEMVIEYFEQLPESNNGNILSFITARDRFLLNGEW